MKDPNQMTKEELIAIAEKFSGYEGNFANPEFAGLNPDYSGYGDSHVDFIGKGSEGSFFNLNDSEPFQITVVNSNTAVRTFLLSFGLYYIGLYGQVNLSGGVNYPLAPGTFPAAGGYFQAVEDALAAVATDYSLNISCPNPNQSILKYINFVRQNASFSHIIQATSTQPVGQLTAYVMDGRTGVIRDETLRAIPWRKYGDGDQYNLQFIDLKESVHMDDINLIQVQVAGSSTLNLNIYMSAADNGSERLRKRVKAAKHTAAKHHKKHGNFNGLSQFNGGMPQLALR